MEFHLEGKGTSSTPNLSESMMMMMMMMTTVMINIIMMIMIMMMMMTTTTMVAAAAAETTATYLFTLLHRACCRVTQLLYQLMHLFKIYTLKH